MANQEHLKILRSGVEAWNEWRKNNPGLRADLIGADLRGTNLTDADLSGAKLGGANLSGAKLIGADLIGADLIGANLYGSDLRYAYLIGAYFNGAGLSDVNLRGAKLGGANLHATSLEWADLSGADLSSADLSSANLRGAHLNEADLSRTDLSGASIGSTSFGNVNLNEVKGLDTVEHYGPSTVGVDTLYKSKGNIPEIFLRGAGVPEVFITYLPSLMEQLIQYYSCFISYSNQDQEFAERLHADLQQKGVRCWFAPEDIKGGKKLYPQIDQAIRLHEKLLLLLSEQSINSEWVMTEIRRARQAELREKQRKLFPVRLVDMETIQAWECFDADTGKDLAVEVREYFIPDFSNWKDHDAYQQGFERLLKDLTVKEE